MKFFLGCVTEADKEDKLEEGLEEKEGYHSVIKIASEKQELPPVNTNQNNFIKPTGKRSKNGTMNITG